MTYHGPNHPKLLHTPCTWIPRNPPRFSKGSYNTLVKEQFARENGYWLVVWNMFIFPYLENHHPNWRTHIFIGVQATNQWFIGCYWDVAHEIGNHLSPNISKPSPWKLYPLVMTVTVRYWSHGPVEMTGVFPVKVEFFHSYVKLPEGNMGITIS